MTETKKQHTPIIYLDYQSTTPLDTRVSSAMMPYFVEKFGNPHSRNHKYGWEAEDAVEEARKIIAESIHADPKDLIFTSGATESNNLALKGVARFYKEKGNHIITTCIEHKCIMNACKALERDGFEVTYLPVQKNGLIDLDAFERAIKKNTILASVFMVHNEIGVIQPIKEIGEICRKHGVFLHTDAAQALGKIPIDVETMNIDLMSLSAHKVYGPKGIGGLYVRRKNPRVRLRPLIDGGGQERGMRSGTLATPLIVGFGKAVELAQSSLSEEWERLKALHDYFYEKVVSCIPEVALNGDSVHRVPHNLNLSFAGVEGESLIIGIKEVAVSSGSACTSASLETSHVLKGIGVSDYLAHSSIRFGLGRFTTKEELEFVANCLIETVKRLREMSPLWEMMQKGIDLEKVDWNSGY